MLEYRVFLRVESEDAPVMLTQYYRCVFITCTLKQMFEKSNGMHPCFERNSRFWGLNHVVLSRFRRTYVGSLSVHFLKEKQSKFQEKSYFIAISQVRVRARYRLYGRLRTPGFRRLFSNLSRNVEGHFARRNERRISREI